MALPIELRRAYEDDDLIVVVGPELSTSAGLPDLTELATQLLDYAGEEGLLLDRGRIESWLERGRGSAALGLIARRLGARFQREVERRLSDQGVAIPRLARAIACLSERLRAVYTVNLDRLLERAFADRWPSFATPRSDLAQRRDLIVKLRGTLEFASSWVLTLEHEEREYSPGSLRRSVFEAVPCPSAPQGLELSTSSIKHFELSWGAVPEATHYKVLVRESSASDYVQVQGDTQALSMSMIAPLHLWINASFIVQACDESGCTDSAPFDVSGTLVESIGYLKASNTGADDHFGGAIALSGDGRWLAVGATGEGSLDPIINGDQGDSMPPSSAGAVYVFERDEAGAWQQQAYIKPDNIDDGDGFGGDVALSNDGTTLVVAAGNTLAVGAPREAGSAPGIDGPDDDDTGMAGAVYLFERDEMTQAWAGPRYFKSSAPGVNAFFGWDLALDDSGDVLVVAVRPGTVETFVRDQGDWSVQSPLSVPDADLIAVSLSGDGSTLAIGDKSDASSAVGIDGVPGPDPAPDSGAVWVYSSDGMGSWIDPVHIKASNTDEGDWFGYDVALSDDGDVLAACSAGGAPDLLPFGEDSSATGVHGEPPVDSPEDDLATEAGAVYVFIRGAGGVWAPRAYVKASNTDSEDFFGSALALDGEGETLAVGSTREDSDATDVGSAQGNAAADFDAGAVYLY